MDSILCIDDLHFSIGESSILQGASFNLRRGEVLGLIGPNGSGKTTLFNCLCGFLSPSRGRILLDGSDITRDPPHARARAGIGRVFQSTGIFREMTLFENMQIAFENSSTPTHRRVKGKELRGEIDRYLARVGLAGKARERASALSGGQARLLEIIRLLAFGAEVFLLDEPTAGVSPALKAKVAGLIAELQSEGRSMVVIEHDLNFIASFCDRILVLESGRVVLEGSPREVQSSELLREIYLGTESVRTSSAVQQDGMVEQGSSKS